ncbi:MAG: hypothetical protein PF447_01410 [Spirochaetaceae bacterium]|jgi:hypothetical protein|nr:hypothetical protein [Spirochaetaceae bacterium]
MSIRDYYDKKLLEAEILHNLVPFSDKVDLENDCKKYKGNPRRHPYDKSKIILIPDPESEKKLFLEFLLSDIAHIEELPNMTSDDGISLTQITLWVKKGCWGVRTEGFKV